MEYQVTLRIVLLNPPNGVLYCLEDDNERFVFATMSTGDYIVFEFQTVVKIPLIDYFDTLSKIDPKIRKISKIQSAVKIALINEIH